MKRILAIVLSLVLILSSTAIWALAEETTTVTVPVTVSGEYQGTNYWANATYTFEVTDGVAAEFGWLSNGDYKFIYYPATGQIKNSTQSSAFALEDGKGIPEYIVIPYTIETFKTDYAEYPAKTIALYSQNTNYAIFRYNASANTKIVIPEGVTAIPDNVFGQNEKSNKEQEWILPSTLEKIGKNSFAQSSGGGAHKEIVIPDSVTSLGSGAFSNCRFTQATVPAGVTEIPGSAFAYNTNLQSVTIKGDVTSVGGQAFRKCRGLTSITFEGSTAPTISSSTFQDITELNAVVYYKANGTGYTDEAFTSAFPTGVTFERLPGEPIVENLQLSGKNVIGETLTAVYDFVDPLGREESGSTVTWTSCEDADFESSEVFELKTEQCSAGEEMTYVVQETDDGKYIRCTVTPRNADTTLNVGIPVSATMEEKIRLPQTIPMVTVTSPSEGYYVNANSPLTISADATCDITTITKVEFYANDVMVAEDDTAPYSVEWTPTEVGPCRIYAKAYNAIGEDQISDEVSVNVLEEGADLSTYIVTDFTSPAPDSFHLSNAEVTFEGTAQETSGSPITSIDIYANGVVIGHSDNADFSFKASLAAGKYSIKAVVKSADGKTGSSEAFDITVSGMRFGTMIADDMVLQRNKTLKISGFGVDGTQVTAELLGQTASATVSSGKWTVEFPPMPTTKSTTLKFTASDGTSAEFTNIAIGEVIMCSGQSNMTTAMGNAYSEYRDKDYPDIRMFVPPDLYASSNTPQTDIEGGLWKVGTTANAKTFSTVGWLTGRSFYDYTNGEIPIGLIWAATSGTSIQTWVPNGTYDNDPDLKKISTNGSRYNAHVAPWLGFTIGQVIWYQGESNSFHSQNYEKNLTVYIDTYRKVFDDETMKFIIIQLPTYDAHTGYNSMLRSFTLVREGQWNVSQHLDGVVTVVSIDTGSTKTVHPGDKLALSQRAARAIQHFACPEDDIVWQSPSYDHMEVKDGKAILYFKDAADGLKTTDGMAPRGFKLADDNGVFNDVEATLVGNTVEIDVSSVTGDVKIRYAYEEAPAREGEKSTVNLVNSGGFPMAPFRTDNDKTHFSSYDSETGTYSGEYNFTPMVRYITAGNIENGTSKITINARDYDDEIVSVEVFIDGVSAGNAVMTAYDTWEFNWTQATEGTHQIHAIATDKYGETSVRGCELLGSVSVSPVKYEVNLTEGSQSAPLGSFTDLQGNRITNFENADGVMITSTVSGKLILAAYSDDNKLVNCVVSSSGSASLTAQQIEGSSVIKAFIFEDMETIKPLTSQAAILEK